MTPLVSIVMAAKNYARFLPMAVRSVLGQSFPNWELLIIDDGSTDGTAEVVKPFLKDARVRYFPSDRLGQSRAKNLGLRLSCGQFIAFLDADDAWRQEKLTKQLAVMMEDERIGIVATGRELIDAKVLDVEIADCPSSTARTTISLDEIFVSNPICFSSVLVRREVFDRVGSFDEALDLSIDYDLWLRVASHYEIVSLPDKLVLYRTGHGNLSAKQSDRIATALTIMNLAVHRRAIPVSTEALHEGYASTHRSLGWLYRRSELLRALKSYVNALRFPNNRHVSMKGVVASMIASLHNRRETLSPENQPRNV